MSFLVELPENYLRKSFDAPIDEAFQQFNRSAHRGNADGMFLGRFLQNLITTGTDQKVSLIETLLSQRYFYKKCLF